MYQNNLALNFNEKVMFNLRAIYNKCGYSQYKMSKFEEYDLYAKNKDFLISDSIITFTDTNGKLMALKPDVTLSIIKNSKDLHDSIQKVYYNENVYRISKGSQSFKEIMQVGLECFGNIDNYNICEIITLACKSLKVISDNCVLDLSHLGLLTSVFDAFDIPSDARKDLLKYIGEKNLHEMSMVCKVLELSDVQTSVLNSLILTTGTVDTVIPKLRDLLSSYIGTKIIDDFSNIINALDKDTKSMIRIDFSVVSDTHYYNNIVFKGFINGVPTSVLSGGQYDKLMQKMKRKSSAIGFAVYLDAIERLEKDNNDYDVDIVLLYNENDSLADINKFVQKLIDNGNSVLACTKIPEQLKYKEIITFNKSEAKTLE